MWRRFCDSCRWEIPALETKTHLVCAASILMAVYLWLLPIGHTIAMRNLAFFLLIFLTLWAAWRYSLRLHLPLALPWLVYGAVALFSVTYAIDPLYSLGEVKKEVGYALLGIMLAASWVRNAPSLSRLMAMLIIGNFLMVGASLVKGLALHPFWHDPGGYPQIDSLYDGVGKFSTYLVTVIPFIFAYTMLLPHHAVKRRALLYLLLGGNGLALYLTSNRMGQLALAGEIFLAVAVVAVQKRAKIKLLLAATVLLIAIGGIGARLMMERSPQHDPRWTVWRIAIDNIKSKPLSGGGFGRYAFTLRNPTFRRTHSQLWHAHNMILDKGVQMGLPGILAFVLLLAAAGRAMWPRRALAAHRALYGYALAGIVMTGGIFLKNMTDDFFVNDGAFLYWILTGAVIGALANERSHIEGRRE